MTDNTATRAGAAERRRKPARPLDNARLEELALAYAARFATTAAKLSSYLRRKLRERGFEGDGQPDVAELVARFVANGFVDDAAYGRARARGLVARGYGARRVEEALRAAGVEEPVRDECAPGEAARRGAAVSLARRRGFGPFGSERGEDADAARKRREKQLAAMLRAGHDFAAARLVVDARTIEELEQWVDEADSES